MHTTQQINAWEITSYGGPETLTPVTRPMPQPKPTEVLVEVRASAVTRADVMMRAGTPKFARPFLGWKRPRHELAGTCFSGEVVSVGASVSRFSVGDQVFGMSGLTFSANASHICADEKGVLMPKPASLSHEEAAAMGDGPVTSLNFLREVAELKAGEKVLVVGAAGSLGSAAVQIAAAMGADVTGVCSGRNAGLVASLGASNVINYAKQDFTQLAAKYDVVYDTLGVSSFRKAKRVLRKRGRYVCPALSFGLLGAVLRTSIVGSRKARFAATGILKPNVQREMNAYLIDMVRDNKFAPVMDRTYPFDQLVEAHSYVDSGHKRGNVVIV